MVEPLSIITGVTSLLGATLKAGIEIQRLIDGISIASVKVKSFRSDVDGFAHILRLMKDTLEQEKIQSSMKATGHVGNHWSSLAKSIEDGNETVFQLQETLDKVNKSVRFLDSTRRHFRLQSATEEILIYQNQIRSYKDTLQLSLQTVVLWNQVTHQESADQILPNLNEVQAGIRRVAFDINDRIRALHYLVEAGGGRGEIDRLNNLRSCVRHAASVVSSASTGIDGADESSEFGDCFPSEPSETMLRWMSSNTVYEDDEEGAQDSSRGILHAKQDSSPIHSSDSEAELEVELIEIHINRGKNELANNSFESAERLFRKCLSRVSDAGGMSPIYLRMKIPLLDLLIKTCVHQEKWTEAEAFVKEKLAVRSRSALAQDISVPYDMLSLTAFLISKRDFPQALLYGRQALRAFRKAGEEGFDGVERALSSLQTICRLDGDPDEAEAYESMLLRFRQQRSPAAPITAPVVTLPDQLHSQAQEQHSSETGVNSSDVDNGMISEQPVPVHAKPASPNQEGKQKVALPLGPSAPAQTYGRSFEKRPKIKMVYPEPWGNCTTSKPALDTHPPIQEDMATSLEPEKAENGRTAPASPPLSKVLFLQSPVQLAEPDSEKRRGVTAPTSITSDRNARQDGEGPLANRRKISPPSGILAPLMAAAPRPTLHTEHALEPTGSLAKVEVSKTPVTKNSRRTQPPPELQSGELQEGGSLRGTDSASKNSLIASGYLEKNIFDDFLIAAEPSSTRESSKDDVQKDLGKYATPSNIETSVFRNVKPTSSDGPSPLASEELSHEKRGSLEKRIAPTRRERLRGMASKIGIRGMPPDAYRLRPTTFRRIAFVGERMVGKTSLQNVFSHSSTLRPYGPAVSKQFETVVTIDGKQVSLTMEDILWERDNSYRSSLANMYLHAVVICFAIDNPDSLEKVKDKWIGLRVGLCWDVPVLLVGCKKDLRYDSRTIEVLAKISRRPVTVEEAVKVQKRVGAVVYIECSAKTNEGVQLMFETAARCAMNRFAKGEEAEKRQ